MKNHTSNLVQAKTPEYILAKTIGESLLALQQNSNLDILAGGTDLLVNSGTGKYLNNSILDISSVDALCTLKKHVEYWSIGATVTYSQLLANDELCSDFPMLATCCAEVGAWQIQNKGTLGGNVSTSSPVGDTLPVLLALDATIVVASERAGERRIKYSEYCTGYRKTARAKDELLISIEIPTPQKGALQVWRKVGSRGAQTISKVSFAAYVEYTDVKEGNKTIDRCRIAFGAVADRAVRVGAIEGLLMGKVLDEDLIQKAVTCLQNEISPIDDLRSSAVYRKQVASHLLARALRALLGE